MGFQGFHIPPLLCYYKNLASPQLHETIEYFAAMPKVRVLQLNPINAYTVKM